MRKDQISSSMRKALRICHSHAAAIPQQSPRRASGRTQFAVRQIRKIGALLVDVVPLLIFVLVAAHPMGQGAVIRVFISEIFPHRDRARGQTLGSSAHWILAATITTFFPQWLPFFRPVKSSSHPFAA